MFESNRVSEGMVKAFEAGFPRLSLDVSWRERTRARGVWTATVRSKEGGRMVSMGVRHHQALAVGQALAGIPEQHR